MCHLPGTTDLPLPDVAAPTMPEADGVPVYVKPPISASCTDCHDSMGAEVHAILQTQPETMVESCAVCHGPSATDSVESVHELEP
jgi:cytochrome c553